MQTRSSINLKDVPIKDLLLSQSNNSRRSSSVEEERNRPPTVQVERVDVRPAKTAKQDCPPTRRERRRAAAEVRLSGDNNNDNSSDEEKVCVSQRQQYLQEAYGIIESQSELIVEQISLISHLREELDAARATLNEGFHPQCSRMLVLDTESFRFDMSTGDVLLPLQLAWGIYEWDADNNVLEELSQSQSHRTIYVSELMCLSQYRNAVKAVSERCFQRHEQKMKEMNFPLMTAFQVLETLQQDIEEFNVDTIVGYNLSWDFMAIGELVRSFFPICGNYRITGCPTLDSFDPNADNPLNPMGLRYLDLMHEVVKKYGEDLVIQGIRDGTVHRAATSNRIQLRRDNRYSKSIYSAEYVLKHFFGVTQNHLADDDVRYEALLLEKCIKDFGLDFLEYNIFYPQQSCYQRMVRLANLFYEEEDENLHGFIVGDEVGLDDGEDDESDEDFDENDEEIANILRSFSAGFLLQDQSQPQQQIREECLFVDSDHASSDEADEADEEAASNKDS
jgi:hypothetical protein